MKPTDRNKGHFIAGAARVVEGLEALNRLSGATMVLFVTDGDGRLVGSLTDGDIRRALLAGRQLDDPVDSVCKRDCLRIENGNGELETIAKARKLGITLLPIVEDGRIVDLLDLRTQRGLLPLRAVLMAGGMGERLRPLTIETPKPLLPVDGKPIIDHTVALLRSFGVREIAVAVNYLKEKLKTHFEGSGLEIIEEPKRMGTIGALTLIADSPRPTGASREPILVMNADLLTDIDLEAMYRRHKETGAQMTVAVVSYPVSVPFAIVEHTGDRITGLTEKPTYTYYANAGIYIIEREAIRKIPAGEYYDATDLIDSLIKEGRRVSLYPIEGRWTDIGTLEEYTRVARSR